MKTVEEKPTFHSDSASIDIALEDIVYIDKVQPCLAMGAEKDSHYFIIHTTHPNDSISNKNYQVIYPSRFEAEAVRAALHGRIIETREKDVWWIGYRRVDVDD